MGCASDRVSYEASKYSQGLLTYALLQGMRGGRLREGEYVDVMDLFQYAADQVPQLAMNIGGIQKPLVLAPRGTSFDIGRLVEADRKAISMAKPKPLILRPHVDAARGLERRGEFPGRRRLIGVFAVQPLGKPDDDQSG